MSDEYVAPTYPPGFTGPGCPVAVPEKSERMRVFEENTLTWKEKVVKATLLIRNTHERDLFEQVLYRTATGQKVTVICGDLKISWGDIHEHCTQFPVLRDLYYMARSKGEELRQLLREDEADRRAVDGVDRGIYHQGFLVATEKKYSDSLLALMLKAGNPDKYADRQQVAHSGVVLNLQIEGVKRDPVEPIDV